MHHMKAKSLAKKYAEAFIERGEDEVRQLLQVEDNDIEGDDIDKEIDQVIAEIRNQIVAALKKPSNENAANGEIGSEPSEKRKVAHRPEHKVYDLYRVQKEMVDNGEKQVFTGEFLKVGKPIRTNVKIEPWRAEEINAQSVNSGQRLYEVEVENIAPKK